MWVDKKGSSWFSEFRYFAYFSLATGLVQRPEIGSTKSSREWSRPHIGVRKERRSSYDNVSQWAWWRLPINA